MRRFIGYLILLLFVGGIGLAAYLFFGGPEPRKVTISADSGDAVRGTYLAHMGGCVACHTNSKQGGALMAGGPPIKTPFGTFYGPNITPDKRTGIGSWTLQDFADAMTAGLRPDGRPYYPVFPYTSYTLMSDQDLADLWAALHTVPAVEGRAPANKVDQLYDHRFLLIPWQTLFMKPGPYKEDPNRSEAWNRGAFIVNGPGHCVACHTPRNILGGPEEGEALQGGSGGPGGERVPAITKEALTKAGWTAGDIAYALKTGLTPEGDAMGGSMGEVVTGSTSMLSDEDRQAIATYLLDQ